MTPSEQARADAYADAATFWTNHDLAEDPYMVFTMYSTDPLTYPRIVAHAAFGAVPGLRGEGTIK